METEKMKANGIIVLVFGCLALLGTFLPLANADPLFFNISHGGGALPLLYLIPVVLIGLGSATLAGKMRKLPHFVIPLSIIALLLAGLGVYTAMEQLRMMSTGVFNGILQMLGEKSKATGMGTLQVQSPSMGLGGWLLVLSYLGAGIGSLLVSGSKTKIQRPLE